MQNKEELEIFKRLSDELEVVFDVGTRDDIDYYLINPKCEYHLFEPNVNFFNTIKNKLNNIHNDKKIYFNNIGLSNETVTNAVYFNNTESFVQHWQGISVYSGDFYNLSTIDEYVESNNIKKISFLKTDCEEMDFKVLVGGLKTIKLNNCVDFLQTEYSSVSSTIDLFNNFDFYLMMEPGLYDVINKLTDSKYKDIFNKSLVKVDFNISRFIDKQVSNIGCGGNLFGINKNKKFDVQKLIFDI